MAMETWQTQGAGLVALEDVRRFIAECLRVAGASRKHAEAQAAAMADADYDGHLGAGLNRLELQVKLLALGRVDGEAEPAVLHETAATAWVDGRQALGAVTASFCLRIALAKAAHAGVALVCAKGSNDYGRGTYYMKQAVEEGMIGVCCSNSTPAMSAGGPGPGAGPETAGRARPVVGCNPVCLCAPALFGDALLAECACSVASLRRVALCRRLRQPLPAHWATDEAGRPTRRPDEALRVRCLAPLGQHKGLALALAVEALTGALAGQMAAGEDEAAAVAGAREGEEEREEEKNKRLERSPAISVLVLDPRRFAPDFPKRMYDLLYRMRGMDAMDPKQRILAPGDPERAHRRKVDKEGGVSYPTNVLKNTLALAQLLQVEPPKIK